MAAGLQPRNANTRYQSTSCARAFPGMPYARLPRMRTDTMNAALLDQHGGPFRVARVPRPPAGPGQVLVQIKASAVNPLDLKIRAGEADHAKHRLPAILGIDLAGIVMAVGDGVAGFRPGDQVYGMAGGVGGVQGSLADYAAADADLLALKPANLSMREAASLPLVFTTAWEGLVDRARVRKGQRVLVQGGAGGVGRMAVQLARAFGAQVFATGSASSAPAIRQLGATPINYRKVSVDAYVAAHTAGRGFDVVFDTAGGASLDASFRAVARFGHVVSALGWGQHSLAPLSFRAASYSGIFTLLPLLSGDGRAHHGEIMREATRLVEAGQVIPLVDERRFDLVAIEEAHAWVAGGDAVGKVVVDLGTTRALI
jgi:NADPH:quinone reductase